MGTQIPAVIDKVIDPGAKAYADRELGARKRELEPVPNFVDLSQHPWASQRPDHWVYIFNTVDRQFTRERPPHFPSVRIPACPKEQRYILVMRVASVMNTRDERKDTFEIVINAEYGERFAADLVNPQNLSADMWARIDPKAPHAYINADGGDDLGRRGVFWTTKVYCENCNAPVRQLATDIEVRLETVPGEGSRQVEYCVKCRKPFHAKPGDDELRKSAELVRAFCQSRIEACGRIAADPRSPEIIGPEDHWCADHLQVSPMWHTHMAVPSVCEDCGGPIKGDPMFHKNEDLGVICVRHGQEGWKKAVSSGVKRRDDVPEDMIWWEATEENTRPKAGRKPKEE